MQRRDLRDLKGRGPWAVASERSEDATKGPSLIGGSSSTSNLIESTRTTPAPR